MHSLTHPSGSVSRCMLAAVLTLAVMQPQASGQEPPVSPDKIQRAIEKARDWLIREQEGNGSWEC